MPDKKKSPGKDSQESSKSGEKPIKPGKPTDSTGVRRAGEDNEHSGGKGGGFGTSK